MMTNRRKRAKAGFTLAELLIVVAIIGILAAISIIAVVQHQRSLKLTEMDNIAREIYEGAQNHLTSLETSGAWEKKYESYDSSDTESMTAYYGEVFDQSQDGTYTVSSTSTTHDFRTITVNASNADSVLSNTALSMILPSGSIDEAVRLGGTYVIEYDAATAQVYGVFYTEDPDFDINYDDPDYDDVLSIDEQDGRTDKDVRIQYKDPDNNKKYAVGYYGGADAEKKQASDTVTEDVQAPEVELINEERLILKVTYVDNSSLLKKNGLKGTKINLKIDLYDADSADGSSYSISTSEGSYDGYKSETVTVEGGGSYQKITEYYIIDSVVDKGKHLSDNYPNLAGKNIAAKVTVSFGTGTNKTSRSRVSNIVNSLYADGTTVSNGKVQKALISNARHLENLSSKINKSTSTINVQKAIITDDITWYTAKTADNDFFEGIASENEYLNKLSDTDTQYVVFSDGKKGTSAHTFYGIYNDTLHYVGNVGSNLLSDFTIGEDTAHSVNNAGLFCSLSSDGTDVKILGINMDQVTLKGSGSGSDCGGAVLALAYGYDKDYTLTNISVSNLTVTDVNTAGGIVGKADKDENTGNVSVTISNSTVSTVTIHGDGNSTGSAGGMIGSVITSYGNNSILYSTVSNVTIDGKMQYAGGLIGEISTGGDYGSIKVTNTTIENPVIDSVDGSNAAAGGAIAYVTGWTNLTITDTSVRSTTENGGTNILQIGNTDAPNHTAGGLIGKTDTIASMNITNASVVSQDGTVNSFGRSAGGLIGEVGDESWHITINNSYVSVAKVQDSRTTWDKNAKNPTLDHSNEYGVGGFIGSTGNSTVTIDQCYVAGRTSNGTYTEDDCDKNVYAGANDSVGGFIGKAGGNLYVTNSYTTASVYSNAHAMSSDQTENVSKAYTGGFIGKTTESSDSDGGVEFTNVYSTGLVTNNENTSTTGAFAGYIGHNAKITSSYALKGINDGLELVGKDNSGNSSISYESSSSSNIAGAGVSASPYDSALSSTYTYKSTAELAGSTGGSHVGDWPIATEETSNQSFDGDFGIIYYEIVQHGSNKNSRDYYYHGFMGDLTVDGSNSNFEEVNTSNTNSSALSGRPYNDHGLLTGHDEYVVEEGYIILISNAYSDFMASNQQITVEIGTNDGDQNRLTLKDKQEQGKLGLYSSTDMEQKFKIIGYSAYVINQDSYTDLAVHSTKLEITNSNYSGNNRGNVNAKADFSFQPMFSDTLSLDAPTDNIYSVYKFRSAQELKYMFEKGGNSMVDILQNAKAPLEQELDISYDSDLVQFTRYNFSEQKVETVSADDDSYTSAQYTGLFKTTYTSSTPAEKTTQNTSLLSSSDKDVSYKLDGLNRTFLTQLNGGTVQDVYVQNTEKADNVSEFVTTIEGGGKLLNSTFDSDYYTSGVVTTNMGTIDQIIGKKLSGSHFVNENISGSALMSNITITDSTFNDEIVYRNQNNAKIQTVNISSTEAVCFVYENIENNSSIDDVHIENAELTCNISANSDKSAGFARTSDSGCSITNSSITYSTIGNVGFIYKNEGYVSNCYVANSTVQVRNYLDDGVGAGFAYANRGTIDNCQVYATVSEDDSKSVYQQYKEKYSGHTLYYEPHQFTVENKSVVEAAGESDSQIIQGYDLMVVGVYEDTDGYAIANNKVGGFVYNNFGTITNSSYTGSVYAMRYAGGFAYNNMNKIENCYANAYVYGGESAAGFTVYNEAINDKYSGYISGTINASHALGVVSGNGIGAGFVTYLQNGSETIKNCYTAVWEENAEKTYYPFYNWDYDKAGELSMPTNYVMTDINGDTDTSAWTTQHKNVTYLTDEEFRAQTKNGSLNSLGSAMPDNTTDTKYTVAYSMQNATYPYPMPEYTRTNSDNTQTQNAQLTAYGDWRMDKGVTLSENSITVYTSGTGSPEFVNVSISVISDSKKNTVTFTQDNENVEVKLVGNNRIRLKGVTAGTTKVTVSATDNDGNLIGSAVLIVHVYDHSDSISIDQGSAIEMYAGDNTTLTATVQPSTANQNVTWTSSNSSVATVDDTGELTAVSAGTATIIASTDDGLTAQTVVTVTVKEVTPTGISISQGTSTTVSVGSSQTLSAVITPSDATDQSVTWTSSDSSIVSVDANGTITGVKAGSAVITATTSNGLTASITVTVSEQLSGNISIDMSIVDSLSVSISEQWNSSSGFNTSARILKDSNGHYVLLYGNNPYFTLQSANETAESLHNRYPYNSVLITESTTVAVQPSNGYQTTLPAGQIGTVDGTNYYVAAVEINWTGSKVTGYPWKLIQ